MPINKIKFFMARYFKIESFIGLATLPNAALLFWQTTILAVKIIQSIIINLNFCKLLSLHWSGFRGGRR
jgi:hypothetical protein